MTLLTEWPNQIHIDDCLEIFLLVVVYAFGVQVARLLPYSLGLLLQQHNPKGLGQKEEHHESAGETHDSAEPVVPSPTEIAGGDEVAHDWCENRSAEDGANAGGHGHTPTD